MRLHDAENLRVAANVVIEPDEVRATDDTLVSQTTTEERFSSAMPQ